MYNYSFSLTNTATYFMAAVLPAVILLIYVYRRDKTDKEPGYLLKKLLISGLFAAAVASLLEMAVSFILGYFADSLSITAFAIMDALSVALIEEGAKFHYMKKHTWNDPNFNYTFDGVIYAVFVSLGFAAIENVLYVFMYGMSVAFTRAILSIPAHLAFSVYMGVFYAKAKVCDVYLHKSGITLNLFAGYVTAVLLHWIYDGMLMVGGDILFIAFIGFVILLDISVFLLIKNASAHDKAIY